MIDYFIRGQILAATTSEGTQTIVCKMPAADYIATRELVEGLRVEMWDKDIRFDDRIGSSKTDSNGVFEIQFTEEDFRQEYFDLDVEPEVFFKVFRGRQLLFTTDNNSQKILPGQNPLLIPNDQTGYLNGDACYRIQIVTIEGKEREVIDVRPIRNIPEAEVNIVDILPTSDQVYRNGQMTASVSNIDGKSGSLQQTLDAALSEVLGRNVKANDPKALRETLTQIFTAKEANGRTDYVWTPRTYSSVQTDLGGTVSGAQASLYHRAKAAGNDALKLLDRLYPLETAADVQNIDAMRAIVRTEIVELIEEMGATGGPRVQRVDSLFQLLLGDGRDVDVLEKVGGQLKSLADTFGLVRSQINTVDEERNYSNYLIIKDYITSLRNSWNSYVHDSGGGAFVGTQLVLLSQALSVVAESVEEVYRIMELVFLGPAERQAVYIDFTKARDRNLTQRNLSNQPKEVAFLLPDGTPYFVGETIQLVPPMSVEGLLTWILRFGREEGPAIAKVGGKLGISKSIATTAKRLMVLTQAAAYSEVPNTAFRREGVRRSLRDLAFQLYQVKRLADEIIPPPPPYAVDDIDNNFSSWITAVKKP